MIRHLLFGSALLLTHLCQAASIEVFTDHAHPVIHVGTATVIYLDTPQNIDKKLSEGLSGNIEQASKQFLARINSASWQATQNELMNAYEGLVRAWRLGVTKVPAVVVDDKYVIYGEPNVALATEKIAAFRRKEAQP